MSVNEFLAVAENVTDIDPPIGVSAARWAGMCRWHATRLALRDGKRL